MTENQVECVNDFDIIDYKRPIGNRTDDRTSTYRAHYYLNDTNLRNTMKAKLTPSKQYTSDYMLELNRISDYKDNYLWPRLETGLLANPKLGFKHQYVKGFEERKLKFLSRAIRPPTSISHSDFQGLQKKPDIPPPPIKLPSPISKTKIIINRNIPSYSKYLDPSATTTRLDYCGMTPTEVNQSIARHDNITFYNWPKVRPPVLRVIRGADNNLCDKLPAKNCPKRCAGFHSQVKYVPHTGLTTEVRDNYLNPISRRNLRVYDSTQIRNRMINTKDLPSPNETDYRMLQSKDRVQEHV